MTRTEREIKHGVRMIVTLVAGVPLLVAVSLVGLVVMLTATVVDWAEVTAMALRDLWRAATWRDPRHG